MENGIAQPKNKKGQAQGCSCLIEIPLYESDIPLDLANDLGSLAFESAP